MRTKHVVAFLILFLGFQCLGAHGQVVATWTDSTGNWSNAANWSTLTVPNNGAGNTYSVVISTPNSVVTMDILNDTIDSLNLAGGNSLTISSGNSFTLAPGSTSNSFNYGTINNYGTFNSDLNSSGSSVFFVNYDSSSVINNYGVFNNARTSTLVNSGVIGNNDVLINSGVIASFGGSVGTVGSLTNNNTLINNGSLQAVFAGIFNSGTLANSSTASIDLGGFSGFGFLSNTGILINSGTITGGGILTDNPGSIYNGGVFVNAANGDISTLPSLTNQGLLINNGTIGNECTALGYCSFSNSGTFINNGTLSNSLGMPSLDFQPGCTNVGACMFANTGTLINRGTLNNSGVLANSGILVNSGAVNITNTGTLTTSTNYTQTAGSTTVDGTLAATNGAIVSIQGGTLGGTGTINGNVLMAGTMMPGDAPGTFTIFGNYEQTGTGIFDELIGSSSHSLLVVNGNVVLDPGASLDITLLDGFNPLGQTFDIMDYYFLNGTFANGASFWDDNYLWDVTYGQNQIDITAVQAPEPSSLLLLALGSLTIGAFMKRMRVA